MLAVRFAETAAHKLEERKIWLAQHQAHLRSGALRVVQSGPLAHADGTPAGGLLIVDVETLDDLHRFSDADPFVVHGIYVRVHIAQWHRAIG